MTSENLLSWVREPSKRSGLVPVLFAAIPSMTLRSVIATESLQEVESLPFYLLSRPFVCGHCIVST